MVETLPPRSSNVAVVTVSYGSSEALEPFLRSLREHHGAELKVVVVDNLPGPDGVSELSQRFGAEYVPLPENPGYGAGMNAGVRALGAQMPDAYFFCNPDVLFIEQTAVRLADRLLEEANAGSIGPRVLNEDGSTYPSARDIPSFGTGVGHALLRNIWPSNPWTRRYQRADDYSQRRDAGWLSGAAVMVQREAYDLVGGWDEEYFLHFEDIDLGYRLGLAGFTNIFEPDVSVFHTGGHSLKKHSAIAERAMTKSSIRFMRLRYRGFWRSPLRWAVVAGLQLRGTLKSRG